MSSSPSTPGSGSRPSSTAPRPSPRRGGLAAWREQRAQDSDQPRSRILKDDALIELAMQRPLNPEGFDKLRACSAAMAAPRPPPKSSRSSRTSKRSAKNDLPKLPDRYRGPSPKGAVGDLLRVLLKSVAEDNGVASRIIATSDDIDAIVLDDEADVAGPERLAPQARSATRRWPSSTASSASPRGKTGVIEIEIIDDDEDED